MYYHVRITQKSNVSHDEVKLDLTEEQLRDRFVGPYERGEPIIVNGKTIPPDDIDRIRIAVSKTDSAPLIAEARARDAASSVVVIGGPSLEWEAADLARDVTDEWIRGAPGHLARSRRDETSVVLTIPTEAKVQKAPPSKKVFVVHGHDHALKADLEVFLKDVGLQPILLHREPDEGRTLLEKFEHHADVAYVIVLLTPDDIGYPVSELGKHDSEPTLEYRARQNVIFELGFFAGKLGRSRVCCIYKRGVTLPSDLAGFVYKEIKDSIEEVGYTLIKEFRAAKLPIEMKS
jgi:predicted nucleotide-binding protein